MKKSYSDPTIELMKYSRGIGPTFSKVIEKEKKIFNEMAGAKIINVGFHPEVQEGGFTIDYEQDGKRKRLILGFTELGAWIEWEGILNG